MQANLLNNIIVAVAVIRVSQKFCNILVHASLLYVYMTETGYTMVGTNCC